MLAPRILIGVEGDFDGSSVRGKNIFCATGGNCFMTAAEQDWIATLRGRIGYTFGHVLVYGTGGWAWTETHTDRVILTGKNAGQVASASSTESGWTAGGGVEIGILPNMSVKAEYLWVNYDVDHTFSYPNANNPTNAFRHSTGDAEEQIWRVGLNIKLGDRCDAEPLK